MVWLMSDNPYESPVVQPTIVEQATAERDFVALAGTNWQHLVLVTGMAAVLILGGIGLAIGVRIIVG